MRGIPILHQYKGEMLKLSEIAERTGLTEGQLLYRMKERGCTAEEAVTAVMHKAKRCEWDGEMLRLSEISARTGIRPETIRNRLKSGVPLEIAATRRVITAQERAYALHRENYATDLYIADGNWRDACAKKICKDVAFTDPRKLGFKMTGAETYEFRTHTIRFLIELIGNIATVTGRLDSNGAVLIERKYRVSEHECKEVTYDG